MDCREFQKFVHVYLDGEFDARDRGEIEGHLRECDGCRSQARFEHWFRDGVRKSFVPEAAPPELVTRIRAQLAKAPAPRARAHLFAGPIAAMLVLGVLIGYIWSLIPFGDDSSGRPLTGDPGSLAQSSLAGGADTPTPPAARARRAELAPESRSAGKALTPMELERAQAEARAAAQSMAQASLEAQARATGEALFARAGQAVARRMRSAPVAEVVEAAAEEPAPAPSPAMVGERDLPMQFESSDPSRVRTFLEQRLQTPIILPRFRGQARVLGGGTGESDATAQVVYRYKGDNLYLQIRPRRDPTLPAQGIVVREENGHRVAAWQRNGLTYSMTSRLDPVEMVRLVASEISVRRRPDEPRTVPGGGDRLPSNYSEARSVSFSEP